MVTNGSKCLQKWSLVSLSARTHMFCVSTSRSSTAAIPKPSKIIGQTAGYARISHEDKFDVEDVSVTLSTRFRDILYT
jgi:hypothetical protein